MLDLIGRVKAAALDPGDFLPLEPLKGGSLTLIITKIVNLTLWFAGVLAVFFLIYGGILYITAGGDAEKATKGKTAIINAIIGIVVILLALTIVAYIKTNIK